MPPHEKLAFLRCARTEDFRNRVAAFLARRLNNPTTSS